MYYGVIEFNPKAYFPKEHIHAIIDRKYLVTVWEHFIAIS